MATDTEKKSYTPAEKADMFVRQAKEYKQHVEQKTMSLDKEFDFYRSQMSASSARDFGALDVLMYNNPSFRAEFNALPQNRKDSSLQVSYGVTAETAKDQDYFEGERKFNRAAPLDTASNPGGANIVQTTLADTIIYKVEQTGQIIDLVMKDEIPFGNKEYPNMSNLPAGQFVDEATTGWTDIVATSFEVATYGLNKTKLTPRDFGLLASYTQRLLKKVSPATVAFFREVEAKALGRGIEQQILRGGGTGQDATGVITAASTVTYNTNAYITFLDAIGTLVAANTENLTAVMHRKTWQQFKKLRLINLAYKDIIDPVAMKIDDIPVVLSNNTDASVDTTGVVIVGDFDHFLYARTGGLETIEDIYSAAATRKVNVYHTMQIDLAVLIANSFVTFSLTF